MLRKSSMLLYKRVQKFQQRQKKPPPHATGKKWSTTIQMSSKILPVRKKAPSRVFQGLAFPLISL